VNKFKKKYFSYHLIASIIIVISFSLICQFIWFPSPFLKLDGTWRALLTLASIDIIIGPLFTLLLISSKKSFRENFFDLVVIITIQISALSYGLLQVAQERIYALIYLNGVFNPVPIKEVTVEKQKLLLSLPKYKGIYYGTAINSKKESTNSTHLLFSPENYQPITTNVIGKNNFLYNKLPSYVKDSYSDEYIFKVLPGKQGVAVVILDSELSIKDIALL
jgi:phosphoglycerol transferase MdoB-like AlkP superfamily enzyme